MERDARIRDAGDYAEQEQERLRELADRRDLGCGALRLRPRRRFLHSFLVGPLEADYSVAMAGEGSSVLILMPGIESCNANTLLNLRERLAC